MNKITWAEGIGVAFLAAGLEVLIYYASGWGLLIDYQRVVNYWVFFMALIIVDKVNK